MAAAYTEAPAVTGTRLADHLWQVPRFVAIAWIFRADYCRGGLTMLPCVDLKGSITARQMIGYCLALVAASLIPVLAGALLLGIGFLACVVGFSLWRSLARARAVLRASLISLPALLMLWLLDGIPPG